MRFLSHIHLIRARSCFVATRVLPSAEVLMAHLGIVFLAHAGSSSGVTIFVAEKNIAKLMWLADLDYESVKKKYPLNSLTIDDDSAQSTIRIVQMRSA